MRQLLSIILMSIFAVAFAEDKVFNLCMAEVTLRVEGMSTEGGHAFVETCPVFNGFDEAVSYPLELTSDGSFKGMIPLEQANEFVGVIFEKGEVNIGFIAEVSQNEPAILTLRLTPEGNFEALETNLSNSLSPIELTQQLQGAWWAFLDYEQYRGVPKSLYSDWRKVREYELDEILPSSFDAINDQMGSIDLPRWFTNSLKIRFASLRYIPYTASAERFHLISVPEPPMEAYNWLDSLDYSPEMLKHLPFVGIKPFLSTLLRFPCGGLNLIGETPVDQWEEYAAATLKPAISKPSKLLLDLLSGMSYLLQIEIDGRPLSDVQLSNIESAYMDDLGKIIKQYNDQLVKRLQTATLIDFSDSEFNLKQYIDSTFPGQPVIVDLWNTWCGPCLNAIQRVASIKKELPEGIVYIYISDTSSSYQAWQNMANKIPGINIRISQESSLEIGNAFGFTGFPSYIFYDSNHNIYDKMTGFPSLNEYIKYATDISPL